MENQNDNTKIAKFNPDTDIDFSSFQAEWNKIGKSRDNILLLHNFIDPADLELFYNYVQEYKDDDSFKGGGDKNKATVKKENPAVYERMLAYEDLIFQEIKKYFVDKLGVRVRQEPVNTLHFVKWTDGMASGLHADCERPDGTPAFHANFYRLNISALMYLNNNYEGGEIAFPEYDFTLKPEPGDLVIFPSNHRHLITKVLGSNHRYTMPIWFTFDLPDLLNASGNHDAEGSVILWRQDGDKYTREEAF